MRNKSALITSKSSHRRRCRHQLCHLKLRQSHHNYFVCPDECVLLNLRRFKFIQLFDRKMIFWVANWDILDWIEHLIDKKLDLSLFGSNKQTQVFFTDKQTYLTSYLTDFWRSLETNNCTCCCMLKSKLVRL